ncbi:MAG: CHASE domain-containing protein, partial [Syntrophothermus sp.]
MSKFKFEFAASNPSTENTKMNKRLSLFQNNQRNKWIAISILFTGLLLTIIGSLSLKSETEREAKTELDFVSSEIKNKIIARLHTHAQLLRSAAAFFEHAGNITREQWKGFYADQKIERNVPGIQGLGYAAIIRPEELSLHEKQIRSEGFPQYAVKPSGKRDVYTSIIFLEPFSGRNLRAFGYDMYSEPVRKAAMEKARDYDIAALSGKIILVQETNEDVQAGTLMYVPVYRRGLPAATVEERRQAIRGWVYSPYRMNDLMKGILGGYETIKDKNIRLEIYDKPSYSGDVLLYDSHRILKTGKSPAALFSQEMSVTFNGQVWYLRFSKDDPDGKGPDYSKAWMAFAGGTGGSFLLFIVYLLLINTNIRAARLAEELTRDLSESEAKYRTIYNNEIYAICIFDLATMKLLDVNDAYCSMYCYSREELLSGKTIHDITAEQQESDAATALAVKNGTTFIPLRYHKKKDGTVFPVEIVGGPYTWKNKKVMFALAHDITKRKQAEDALLKSRKEYDLLVSNIPA